MAFPVNFSEAAFPELSMCMRGFSTLTAPAILLQKGCESNAPLGWVKNACKV
jgi:hypothetical protein